MDSDRIEKEAAAWLAKRDSGNWSVADEAAFSAWQDESTARRVAVIRLSAIWQQANRLQALGAGVPRGQIPQPAQWRLSSFAGRVDPPSRQVSAHDSTAKPATRTRILTGAVAAGFVLALATVLTWYTATQDKERYTTAIGGIEAVPLADGSRITLNTSSVIRVALTDTERRIELSRGEAFFEVAKDPLRPFIVSAGDKRIVAVGTKFSVLRAEHAVRIVVTEGKVKVEEGASAGPNAPITFLEAGNTAQAGAAGVVVKQASVAEAETSLSWRSGYIALSNTPLPDAIAEFNRYNEQQLVIADPALAELRIGGNVRTTNVQAFVRVLELGFPVRATEEGDRIVLTGR